mmetsp:Transcript_99677/g.228746  ORF Transcript_99677/g.228746 Transcript_99677/m.228746 type:complete len:842 (+) Transcript_99677:3-2528(+)
MSKDQLCFFFLAVMALRFSQLPPFEEWDAGQVCHWLDVLDLGSHKEIFQREQIDGAVLAQMSKDQLKADLGLPLGACVKIAAEVVEQRKYSQNKRKVRQPLMRVKGQLGESPPLSPRTRSRIAKYSGDGVARREELTEEELECWDDQAKWLTCAISGVSWPRDSGSTIGVALYHQPRSCCRGELQRRILEEEHAARLKREQGAGDEETAEPNPEPEGFTVVSRSGECGVGDVYDREFAVYPDVEPPPKAHLVTGAQSPELGHIEVMVGPVFDITAFNAGASGSEALGTLGLNARGVLCLDRQYNAVNFQYFVQRHGNSFARKICTSRLSFFIEEGHGQRIFPRNILNQLSLLFYRRNDVLYKTGGRVDEKKVAECISKGIPKILLATIMEVASGTGFRQYTEHAIRLYLAIHHTAIKILAHFPSAHQAVYDQVKSWMQNPFARGTFWGPEEVMLAASLVSVPFPMLREALVRRVLADLHCTGAETCDNLWHQNRPQLERLAFVQSFFDAGPGKKPVHELERQYTRCAGTLPRAERAAILEALLESDVETLEDWWRVVGMDGVFTGDEACATHLLAMRQHCVTNRKVWELLRPSVSRGPAVVTEGVGAGELGKAVVDRRPQTAAKMKQTRRQAEAAALAEAKRKHEGYPVLPQPGHLPETLCLYCGAEFAHRGALFRHLRKMIPPGRMINRWHALHFSVQIPLRGSSSRTCPAKCCSGTQFGTYDALLEHLAEMGVPGAGPPPSRRSAPEAEREEVDSAPQQHWSVVADTTVQPEIVSDAADEGAAVDPHAQLGRCCRCPEARAALFAPCGHCVACSQCAKKAASCWVCSQKVVSVVPVCFS